MRVQMLIVVACLAFAAPAGAAASAEYDAADTRALNAVAEHWREYWNAHDMEKFAGLFADDVDFVTKSGSWFRGKEPTMEHHRKNHAGIFKDSTWTMDQLVIKYVQNVWGPEPIPLYALGWASIAKCHDAPDITFASEAVTNRATAWRGRPCRLGRVRLTASPSRDTLSRHCRRDMPCSRTNASPSPPSTAAHR